nr:hypothetical protein CFP56_55984 [Quercus suber]
MHGGGSEEKVVVYSSDEACFGDTAGVVAGECADDNTGADQAGRGGAGVRVGRLVGCSSQCAGINDLRTLEGVLGYSLPHPRANHVMSDNNHVTDEVDGAGREFFSERRSEEVSGSGMVAVGRSDNETRWRVSLIFYNASNTLLVTNVTDRSGGHPA